MDISVVVPVYNPPHHLFEENIKSLISQCGDFEFIYINDGSTDEWIDKRLQNLAETDSRIVYIRKQNSGVSDNEMSELIWLKEIILCLLIRMML